MPLSLPPTVTVGAPRTPQREGQGSKASSEGGDTHFLQHCLYLLIESAF